MTVPRGEIFGFLGPNGAGKTTAVKLLLGLTSPTGGEGWVLGASIGDRCTRRRIGYLPELFRYQDWMTAREVLRFHCRLAGIPSRDHADEIDHALATVGLSDRSRDRVGTFSKGMQQRLGLAVSLLGRPELLFLDEPTSALDPVGRREVRDLIHSLRDDGIAVFLNSHLLSEVELVCDRVAIVDRGRVVRSGRLEELVGATSQLRVTVDRVDPELLAALKCYAEVLAVEGPGAGHTADPAGEPRAAGLGEGATVTLAVTDLELAPRVAEAVMRRGYRLFGLVPVHRSLEEVFMDLVEGGER
jgi:ABC-2 type transport system ATP-binding protein